MEMLNGMRNGVSTRTTGNDIDPALRYWGPSSPELITQNHYTAASSAMIKSPSFAYDLPPGIGLKTWNQLRAHSTHLTEIGDYWAFATASNKFLFHKDDIRENGLAFNRDDLGIKEWRAVTELNNTVEYVLKPTGQSGLYEGGEYIHNYSKSCPSMTNVNVPISRWHGVNMDINQVGIGFSKIANAKEHLRNLIFYDYPKVPRHNDETQDLLERLDIGREITALGIENLENAAAKIYWYNGTSTLVESTYIHEKAQYIAQKHGLDGKDAIDEVIRYFLKHELVHNSQHKQFISKRKQEKDVAETLVKFYNDRASKVGEKLARYFRALAAENKDYANRHRISAIVKSRIERLREQHQEALDMGMEEEAAEYANRLDEEIDELELSDLERTIEEEEETSETREDESELTETKEEYSEREMSTDENSQEPETEQEAEPETADESAE